VLSKPEKRAAFSATSFIIGNRGKRRIYFRISRVAPL
jgi:hypothetical protein